MPDPMTLTALSSVSATFSLSLRLTEKVYEVIAVEKEARDLLETTSHISRQLDHAKKLRRQKSAFLSKDEKNMVDDIVDGTANAVKNVAALVEPARADMQVSGGQVRLGTRLLFVFRDMAQIPVSLAKLNIANTNLNMAIGMLYTKERPRETWGGRVANPHDSKPLPTYRESEWLYAQRQQNLRRRASAISLRPQPMADKLESCASSIAEVPLDTTPYCDAKGATVVEDQEVACPVHIRVQSSEGDQKALPDPPKPKAATRRLTGRERNQAFLDFQSRRYEG
ncbi:hypothetical protein LTR28_003250 [Elasticomyces elasticus]|nr:hypothetical protein LTR28_003250 [Elasticomyces elasticus]